MNGLFVQTLQSNPTYFFAVVITVVVSITLHELAHGIAAIKLGDDTPQYTGHMTLNPLVHMGMFSIVMLLLFGIAFGAMPVDRTRLRGRYAESLVAVAGPAANLLLGLLATVAMGLWARFGSVDPASHVQHNAQLLLTVFGITNFALALFNLLPVPPLDGGYIAANLFPAYRRFLGGEFARGVLSAVFIALFIGGGTFIYTTAIRGYVGVLAAVSGPHVSHGSPLDNQADATADED